MRQQFHEHAQGLLGQTMHVSVTQQLTRTRAQRPAVEVKFSRVSHLRSIIEK
jgi:hypothetical protein